ncbi:MAG TPA: PT domain-containing protein [Methanotrichaceae archaeon]|nr:PT domain-containing protein [Methanotrichaceae archaeon]
MKFTEEAKIMAFPESIFSIKMRAYATMVILLIFLFSSLSGATDGNLSISGAKALDINSNGLRDPSDPVLEGYIIYIYKNNDSQWQQNEVYVRTNKNGEYSFSNISRDTYVIRELPSRGQVQLSYPKAGFYFVNLTSPSAVAVTGMDFVSQSGASEDSNPDWIYYVLMVLALVLIGSGFWVLIPVLSKLGSLGEKDLKNEKKTIIQLVSGFLLLLLGIYMFVGLAQISRDIANEALTGMVNPFSIIIPVFLGLLIFGAVMLMCHVHANQHEVGSMRKMIAGVLVIGLIAVIFFALDGTMQNHDIIIQYIQLVGIIIAFYFGSRVAAEGADKGSASAEKFVIEKSAFTSDRKNLELKLSNKTDQKMLIKSAKIDDKEITIKVDDAEIGQNASRQITLPLPDAIKFEPGKLYKIEIDTDTAGRYKKYFLAKLDGELIPSPIEEQHSGLSENQPPGKAIEQPSGQAIEQPSGQDIEQPSGQDIEHQDTQNKFQQLVENLESARGVLKSTNDIIKECNALIEEGNKLIQRGRPVLPDQQEDQSTSVVAEEKKDNNQPS